MSEPGELIRTAIEGWLAEWRWVRERVQAAAAGRRLIDGGRGLETAASRGSGRAAPGYDERRLGLLLGVGAGAEGAGISAGSRGLLVGGRYGAGKMPGKLTGAGEPGLLGAKLGKAGAGERAGGSDSTDGTERLRRQAAFTAAVEQAERLLRAAGESNVGAVFYDKVNENASGLASGPVGGEAGFSPGDGRVGGDRAGGPEAFLAIGRGIAATGGLALPESAGGKLTAAMGNGPEAGGWHNDLTKGLAKSLNENLNGSLNKDLHKDWNEVGEARLAKLLLTGPALAGGVVTFRRGMEADSEEPGSAVAREAVPMAMTERGGGSAPAAWADLTADGSAVDLERLAARVADRLQESLEAELYSRSFAEVN